MATSSVPINSANPVVPGIGRSLHIPDPFIALAFSLSALIWALVAPFWGRRLATHGAKRMVIIGRGIYGTFGAAAPPAAQAILDTLQGSTSANRSC